MRKRLPYYSRKYLLILGISFIFLAIFLIPRIPLPQVPNSLRILDAHGIQIGEIVAQRTYRHIPVQLDQVPKFFQDALIAIEDQRFSQHRGIDVRAIGRAIRNNVEEGTTLQGASTIPAQLVRNAYWLNAPRTVWRKAAEFMIATLIDAQRSKSDILESYINILSFGYMTYGPESAANYYFGKPLNQLTKAEMISLITLPKNPQKYDPYRHPEVFKERFDFLVDTLASTSRQILNPDEVDLIKQEHLLWQTNHQPLLPYIQDTVATTLIPPKTLISGGKITTTIDAHLSKNIQNLAYTTIQQLARKHVSDLGVLVIDRKTNDIKVLMGGLSYYNSGGQVNAVFALNQPGSAIKPFTYLLAFKNLGRTPTTTILDLPVQYKTKEGYTYTPQNFSLSFKGPVSVAEALAESLNVPAVKTANELGVDKLLKFFKNDLRINSLNQSADHYGLALTLGDGDLNLFQLVRAYGVFAHQGKICDLRLFTDQSPSCKQIIESKYTTMVEDILSNRLLRFPSFPMFSNLDFEDRFVALKSGTSRKFSDNRVLGYTDHYLIGIRVGNKDGSPMKGVTGVSGAGDLFKKIVEELEDQQTNFDQAPIPLADSPAPYLQITNPLDASVYKLSDLIPLQNQSLALQFSTNIPYDTVQREVDGVKVQNERPLVSGNHTVSLTLRRQGQEVKNTQVSIKVEKQ